MIQVTIFCASLSIVDIMGCKTKYWLLGIIKLGKSPNLSQVQIFGQNFDFLDRSLCRNDKSWQFTEFLATSKL